MDSPDPLRQRLRGETSRVMTTREAQTVLPNRIMVWQDAEKPLFLSSAMFMHVHNHGG